MVLFRLTFQLKRVYRGIKQQLNEECEDVWSNITFPLRGKQEICHAHPAAHLQTQFSNRIEN